MTTFFETVGWHPGIGDPTFMGWFTVLAYFIAFYLSLKVYLNGDQIFHRIKHKQKLLWLAIACITLFLCINKQLDLQTLFTATAKYLFIEMGMYDSRRNFQELFIIFILMGSIIVGIGLSMEYYKVIANHWLAITGIVFLMAFIVIRASSFHNVDIFLGSRFLGVKMNWVLELSGILLIIINAIKLLNRNKAARRRYNRNYT